MDRSPFISTALKQKIDLILHLTQYSQNILLVLGDANSGKTTLSNILLQSHTPFLNKQAFAGQSPCSLERMMNTIASGFKLGYSDDEEGLNQITQIDTQQPFYNPQQDIWVLLVDDAHLLEDEKLLALLKLVNFHVEPKRQLHLILFGEPSLQRRLRQPWVTSIIQDYINVIELDPWESEDVVELMEQEGLGNPFSERELDDWVASAEGNPGLIVDSLLQYATPEPELKKTTHLHSTIQPNTNTNTNTKTKTKNKFPDFEFHPRGFQESNLETSAPQQSKKSVFLRPVALGMYAGIALGVSYLLVTYKAQKAEVAQFQSDNLLASEEATVIKRIPKAPVISTSESTLEEAAAAAEAAIASLESESGSEVSMLTTLATADDAFEMTEKVSATPTPTPLPVPTVYKRQKATAKWDKKLEKPEKPEKKVEKPVPVAVKTPAKEPVKIAAKALTETKTTHPLLSKNKAHYTMQLYGADQLEKVVAFQRTHHLDKAIIFSKTHQGKTWYVLVEGDYANKEKADNAAVALPTSIYAAKVKPWVRRFESVQAELKT